MSASEYWSKAESLMSEYQFLTATELADELTQAGYILATDQEAVTKEITAHDTGYSREDDDADCKCGKWLEHNYYEWPDHLGSVLDQWLTEVGKKGRSDA